SRRGRGVMFSIDGASFAGSRGADAAGRSGASSGGAALYLAAYSQNHFECLRRSKGLMNSRVRNDLFDSNSGYNRGRPLWVMGVWQVFKWIFFRTVLPWPSKLKVSLLRLFGAKIGRGV